MKSLAYIAIVSLLLGGASFSGVAQCKNFAKKICKQELAPYIHDGNFNAAILTEGEDAELFKTFYAGQEYRISICCEESLRKVEFKIFDVDKKLLYTNANNNYATSWDFKVEATQQLIIVVKIPSDEKNTDIPVSGCVAIMFGLKTE
ncbi:MAG: hypothetical protein HXX16_10010 [Bacteroidales bacterium]|jgi:hypothetical protein|nr:hypothetical protein [Bacteroidales bacterium]